MRWMWGLAVRTMLSQHDTHIIYTWYIHKTLHQQPAFSLFQIYNPLAQKASHSIQNVTLPSAHSDKHTVALNWVFHQSGFIPFSFFSFFLFLLLSGVSTVFVYNHTNLSCVFLCSHAQVYKRTDPLTSKLVCNIKGLFSQGNRLAVSLPVMPPTLNMNTREYDFPFLSFFFFSPGLLFQVFQI